MNYLELRYVRKNLGDVHALRGVSFAVAAGEIVALLGPNGAGKTTSLEIALGLRSRACYGRRVMRRRVARATAASLNGSESSAPFTHAVASSV